MNDTTIAATGKAGRQKSTKYPPIAALQEAILVELAILKKHFPLHSHRLAWLADEIQGGQIYFPSYHENNPDYGSTRAYTCLAGLPYNGGILHENMAGYLRRGGSGMLRSGKTPLDRAIMRVLRHPSERVQLAELVRGQHVPFPV